MGRHRLETTDKEIRPYTQKEAEQEFLILHITNPELYCTQSKLLPLDLLNRYDGLLIPSAHLQFTYYFKRLESNFKRDMLTIAQNYYNLMELNFEKQLLEVESRSCR